MSNSVESLDKLDLLLTELEVTCSLLATVRETYVGNCERLTAARASEANDNFFAVELALNHMHDAYRSWVDAEHERRKHR